MGGHTAEGAEAALGMAVTGVVHPTAVFRKGYVIFAPLLYVLTSAFLYCSYTGPLSSGRVIILTKGLGTGTIMAADMRYAARGKWVAACWQSMVDRPYSIDSNKPNVNKYFTHIHLM